jgi:UDP-N-acetyl-D-glucosamine dehydrogenase
MKVVVIGQGYVGLPLAQAAAEAGHDVVGFDINTKLIEELNNSNKLKNLTLSTDLKDIKNFEIYIIAVPTPLTEQSLPDLSFIKQAAEIIATSAENGALVINESTSYPGTLRDVILPLVTKKNSSEFMFASAPERIDPGNTKWRINNTPRLVGGITKKATDLTHKFYSTFCDEVITLTSAEAAEAAKLLENSFRQVNIALVNEFAQIADKLGISANEVINAAATKPFGYMKFSPGLGVGGHCIPVDPIYLAHKASEIDAPADLIKQASQINMLMPAFIARKILEIFNGRILGKKICIIGLSYKADISDLRESPSLVLWKELEKSGAIVSFHDEIVGKYKEFKSVELSDKEFDIAVVAVHHKNLDVKQLRKSAKYVFDCTGTISGIDSL